MDRDPASTCVLAWLSHSPPRVLGAPRLELRSADLTSRALTDASGLRAHWAAPVLRSPLAAYSDIALGLHSQLREWFVDVGLWHAVMRAWSSLCDQRPERVGAGPSGTDGAVLHVASCHVLEHFSRAVIAAQQLVLIDPRALSLRHAPRCYATSGCSAAVPWSAEEQAPRHPQSRGHGVRSGRLRRYPSSS